MIGAVIGDIAGSRFEFNNIKSKDFELFTTECRPTDDSIMTIALGEAILSCDGDWSGLEDAAARSMRLFGRQYPDAGYGRNFDSWLFSDSCGAYDSCGNGAAMRVSAAGEAAASIDEAIELARKVTIVTHDHPEGLKGAEAVSICIFMAKTGASKDEIRKYICENYYPLNFTLDEIRPSYDFGALCQNTVPQAIEAFLESESFEATIRGAISLGGDSDTLAAIAGSIAAAHYGVPDNMRFHAMSYLDGFLQDTVLRFEEKYKSSI